MLAVESHAGRRAAIPAGLEFTSTPPQQLVDADNDWLPPQVLLTGDRTTRSTNPWALPAPIQNFVIEEHRLAEVFASMATATGLHTVTACPKHVFVPAETVQLYDIHDVRERRLLLPVFSPEFDFQPGVADPPTSFRRAVEGHFLRFACLPITEELPQPPLLERSDWSASEMLTWATSVLDRALDDDDRNAALSAEIIAYRDLAEGWDGPASVAPDTRAIDEALAFIDQIPFGAKTPDPMASADGEVGFYWQSDRGFIDIGFRGKGTISYYGRVDGVVAKGAAAFGAMHALPTDLLELIEKI